MNQVSFNYRNRFSEGKRVLRIINKFKGAGLIAFNGILKRMHFIY